MSKTIAAALVRVTSAIGFVVLLGAAGPDGMPIQIGDVGPLAQPEPAPLKALTFHNTMYQAAPMPDEDAAPPAGSVQAEARVSPTMLSPRALFEGDGYASGSSQQSTLEHRKAGAAGLALSVPVTQEVR